MHYKRAACLDASSLRPASVDAPWNEVYSETALAEATGRHPAVKRP